MAHCVLDSLVAPGQPSLPDAEALISAPVDKSASSPELDHTTGDYKEASKLAKAVEEHVLSLNAAGPGDSALATEAGIACLQLLSLLPSCCLDDSTLLKVVACTDARDAWTTGKAASVASDLLQAQLTKERLDDFVVGPVLQAFLKPLFAKSSSRVTESGRPNHYYGTTDPRHQHAKTTSWKSDAPWAMSTARWAVGVSKPSFLQNNWHLFTPVLLALAEDESSEVKSRGLEILASFVTRCPPAVLQTTGISLVFEDLAFPALLHLPSITPVDESIKLLVPAFQVLINLAEISQSPQSPERRRLLDKVLREGVFAAYFHASQYVRLVQVLVESMESIIKCLGIYSTKHLKVQNTALSK
ncbi:hypothetical protein B0T10DRAFT_459759 [Thelonectria olida]|uniref:Uncharacterized protein n=1 Tax=Thelonectria olida TaxID=1576542 RepID=A0A9P8W658_9HYPO|nr:hypothetical protein B0T10DRAFT_459759 [Thelonectria olida]